MTRQYGDISNLKARIGLHRRFSTNDHPWQRWVFDQFELPPAEADEFRPRVGELTDHLERELTSRGEIRITKDTGLFVAHK